MIETSASSDRLSFLYPCKRFVTLEEARARIEELVRNRYDQDAGQTVHLFTAPSRAHAAAAVRGRIGWRIGVSVEPAGWLRKLLDSLGLPGLAGRVSFIATGWADAFSFRGAGSTAHSYMLLSGSFQVAFGRAIERVHARPLRDHRLRTANKTTFETGDFSELLDGISSELAAMPLSGQKG